MHRPRRHRWFAALAASRGAWLFAAWLVAAMLPGGTSAGDAERAYSVGANSPTAHRDEPSERSGAPAHTAIRDEVPALRPLVRVIAPPVRLGSLGAASRIEAAPAAPVPAAARLRAAWLVEVVEGEAGEGPRAIRGPPASPRV